MKVGDTKIIEWVSLGVPLKPHQRLAQEKRVIASHNHYSVMVETCEKNGNPCPGTKENTKSATRGG